MRPDVCLRKVCISSACCANQTGAMWRHLKFQSSCCVNNSISAKFSMGCYGCNAAAYAADAVCMPAIACHSPPVSAMAADGVQSIGQIGSISSSLIPSPKPGVRSNAAASPSVPRATPPFDAYSQGSFNYSLLNPFYEISGSTVTTTCSGAGESFWAHVPAANLT